MGTFKSMGILRQESDFSRLQGVVLTDCTHLEDVVRSERKRLAPLSEAYHAQLVRSSLGLEAYDSEKYFQQLLGALGTEHSEVRDVGGISPVLDSEE